MRPQACERRYLIGGLLLLTLTGCAAHGEAGRLLKDVRKAVGLDESAVNSLRTVARCESPHGPYVTEMRSSTGGRGLMRQRFPDGGWVWLEMSPEGGFVQDSRSAEPKPMDDKWRTFIQGHEFHFAALAPDARHDRLVLEHGATFHGEAANALLWVDELGGENRAYYRASDALPLGLEVANHLDGPPLVTVRFTDWPDRGGSRLFRTAILTHGEEEFRFHFFTLDVNPSPETLFGPVPAHVSFPTEDGGVVHADLYGQGERGVVLAHGGRFTKESWVDQAEVLAHAGFRVLAFDFRGRGESRGGPEDPAGEKVHLDVLAAVRYLHEQGAGSVSVVGASFGGWAAARASVLSRDREIDRLILLAAGPIDHPGQMKGRKLFVVAREDSRGEGKLRLPEIRDQYERAPDPKRLLVLGGDAHAQFLFDTDQGEPLMDEILGFLGEP